MRPRVRLIAERKPRVEGCAHLLRVESQGILTDIYVGGDLHQVEVVSVAPSRDEGPQ